MSTHLIAFTVAGAQLAAKLQQCIAEATASAPGKVAAVANITALKGTAAEWAKTYFNHGNCLIFIGATGIAVRTIAPYIRSKDLDPAVLVIDEQGNYVISLLSGHIGQANKQAYLVASHIGATPIISTATDLNKVFAVDTWALEYGYHIANVSGIKYISSALLHGEQVGLYTKYLIATKLPKGIVNSRVPKSGIEISFAATQPFAQTLHLIPKCLYLGIGCKRGTPVAAIEQQVQDILHHHQLPMEAVAAIASIDLKKDEVGLCEFAQGYRVPFHTFSATDLSKTTGCFTASSFVKATVGVDNVCERAAVAMGGALIVPKTTGNGVSVAVSQTDWSVRF